jgi:hypothetical protein
MRAAEIHWELFWHTLSQQKADHRISWLGRWVFADDWVRLSMRPAPVESDDADLTRDGATSKKRSQDVNESSFIGNGFCEIRCQENRAELARFYEMSTMFESENRSLPCL